MLKPKANKKGSEMVEAAVVLPLLLLAVISLIYLGIFCQNAFKEQLDVQRALLEESGKNESLFSVISEENVLESGSRGFFKTGFRRAYRQSLYVINEGILVRGGNLIKELGNE